MEECFEWLINGIFFTSGNMFDLLRRCLDLPSYQTVRPLSQTLLELKNMSRNTFGNIFVLIFLFVVTYIGFVTVPATKKLLSEMSHSWSSFPQLSGLLVEIPSEIPQSVSPESSISSFSSPGIKLIALDVCINNYFTSSLQLLFLNL